MRSLVALLLVACGATPRPSPPPPPAVRACQYDGSIAFGDLYDAALDHPIARGSDWRAHVTLSPGPWLRATVEVDGFALEGALRPELEVVAPIRLGPVVAVNAGHRVSIGALDADGVHVGPRSALLDELTLHEPAEAVVGCEALSLPHVEMSDPSADLRAFGLTSSEDRQLVAHVAIELLAEPGGSVAATFSASEYPRRVAVLEERAGAVRIALSHWTDTLVVGWVDAASVEPLGPEDMAGLLGTLAGEPRDLTLCRPAAVIELLVREVATVDPEGNIHALPGPGATEHLGWIAAGTPLVRLEDRDGGMVRVAPRPGVSLYAPSEVEWLVRASELGTECAAEHYDAPNLSNIFRDGPQ